MDKPPEQQKEEPMNSQQSIWGSQSHEVSQPLGAAGNRSHAGNFIFFSDFSFPDCSLA
jgi:hypothetical protein